MNNLGNVVNASRRACYCNQFQTVLSKVRSAVRTQKQQKDKVLQNLTAEKTAKVFPLRGFVGPAGERNAACLKKNPSLQLFLVTAPSQELPSVFNGINYQDSRLSGLQNQIVVDATMPPQRMERSADMRIETDQVECVVQECSDKARQSLCDLFPGGFPEEAHGKLTAVIVSHKTKNDMSIWSTDMELEREELTAQFVEIAKEIVEALKENSVWGDFIDPSSGRPYFSPYTNSTMFETDDRYRHFGFTVQDLGCCKCLEHPIWGPNAFVGCILTSASTSHPILKEILQAHVE
ncbi:cobalamin trafficking protein CblD-like [Paramacrobiotus metropolitanus]|uniref:cobalamin trafficking protein CblD-like n=1 Tax=Paramacrobiotus metropolitanus TaxID=2943436 RepID=UPI002445A7C7|nr:cobalamin trafficking protein CblD-like [Paramacrobiotus metropolitanus]